jgi:hypothetical protein
LAWWRPKPARLLHRGANSRSCNHSIAASDSTRHHPPRRKLAAAGHSIPMGKSAIEGSKKKGNVRQRFAAIHDSSCINSSRAVLILLKRSLHNSQRLSKTRSRKSLPCNTRSSFSCNASKVLARNASTQISYCCLRWRNCANWSSSLSKAIQRTT